MKKLVLFLLLLPFLASFSQNKFNLMNLKSIDVEIKNDNLVNDETFSKLNTDIKVKLKSIGLSFNKPESILVLNLIKVSEDIGFVYLRLYEDAIIKRWSNKEKLGVFTYSRFEFIQSRFFSFNKPVLEQTEKLINEFVDLYLEQNP